LRRTLLEDKPIVEVVPKGLLRAGPHGAFNSYGNNNMIVVATSYDRATLAKMQRLGCIDYVASSQVITDSQLSNLAGLKNIDWLDLSFSMGFSKKGLASFRGTALKKLYLVNTQMDDQWTPVLSSLPLTTLGLRLNQITDRGVEHLAKSNTLKFILLQQNPISEMPSAFKKGGWRILPDEDRQYKWFVRK
jgi:hypothetical protein